jgi:hypothetical protein
MDLFDMLKLSLPLKNSIILGGGQIRDRLKTITRLTGISKVETGGNAQILSFDVRSLYH